MRRFLPIALVTFCLPLAGLLLLHAPARGEAPPLAPDQVEWIPAPAEVGCGTLPLPLQLLTARREGAAPPVLAPSAAEAYPMYAWPLGRPLHDGIVVVNYVDHDPGTGTLDYMGGNTTYDEHNGTDYRLLNFRLMDHGVTIRAATPGTVIQVNGPANFDRHCAVTFPVAVNSILLDTGGGTCTDYYHLRANSVMVRVGDVVQTGQMLGLVGSSGQSSAPHLHLQPWDNIGGQSHVRDPYGGPSNPLPSLWIDQDDYDADNPLSFTDLGVFTAAEVGGNLNNTSYCQVVERLQQPALYSIGEANLPVWVQYQSRAGESGRIDVRRPNGTLFGTYSFTTTAPAQMGWFWVSWPWNGSVSATDYGQWLVQVFSNGIQSNRCNFVVGSETQFGPRFWPRSGRSFRINGAVQRDTLRHSPLGWPVTYSLLSAPSFVSLVDDSVLTIDAVSNQPNRALFFQALMTDALGRQDTAWFHIVDMAKPTGFPVDAGPILAPADLELALAGPSPFGDGTALRYRLAAPGRVSLGIYDLRGRRVRMLVEGEEARAGESITLNWDGRDGRGMALPGGVYFARLDAGGARRVLKIARLP